MDLSNAVWRKSSYTSSNGGNCVEVADSARLGTARVVAVRDSKDPDGPKLAFGSAQWQTFLRQVKADGLGLV